MPACPTAFPDKLKNFNKAKAEQTNKSNFGVNVHEIGIKKCGIIHSPPPPPPPPKKKNPHMGFVF